MHHGFDKLKQFLDRNNKIILSTHESPDWDGLGSEIAMYNLLAEMGKEVRILNSDALDDDFNLINTQNIFEQLTSEESIPDNINQYGHIILDTSGYNNIGQLPALLETKVKETFIIDHHEGDENLIRDHFIQIEASSVCELIFQIYEFFGIEMNFTSAQAIFSGIVFDTGSFRYPKTSSETFRIASELVSRGINPDAVYQHIYENNKLSSLTIRNMIINSMEILLDGKLALMKLTPEMLIEANALYSEGELAINIPLTIKGINASVLVKQNIDSHKVKVSMRSRGDINVATIARTNNGGGHKNAAGYKSSKSFDETYEDIRRQMIILML